MEYPQRCNPMDMVRFLLAFCCADDPSGALCNAQAINECLGYCWKAVVPVANSRKMRQRLEK